MSEINSYETSFYNYSRVTITRVEYQLLKEERDVTALLLYNLSNIYENLVDDIINGKSVKIGNVIYKIIQENKNE
jgi:hypothetical protein